MPIQTARTFVAHRLLALPLIVATIVGLSACSSHNAGTPVADSPLPTSSTPQADLLADVDPCSLITQSDESSSQLNPGYTIPAAGGRGCRWDRPDDGATIDGYTIQIVIYNTAGIDQLNTEGGTVTDYSIDKYQGKVFQDTPTSNCFVSLATTSTSRIDMAVNSGQGMTKSCSLAQEVAPVVVSHFPTGS